MRLASGTQLGHYEIVAFIGKGGMGEVYRARDLSLRREVAVKVLQSSEVDADSWSRFEREAHSASALNHPNICTVHDLGEADGQPFLVMELVDGVTLRQAIENRTLDPATVVPVAIQIADALEAAHARNIVHRDVKPGNVMITGRGHVKVLDFGLAKLAPGAASGHTATIEPLTAAGAVVGTPQFLSPEMLQGGHVDAAQRRVGLWRDALPDGFGRTAVQGRNAVRGVVGDSPRPSTAHCRRACPRGCGASSIDAWRKRRRAGINTLARFGWNLESLRAPATASVGSRRRTWLWVAGAAAGRGPGRRVPGVASPSRRCRTRADWRRAGVGNPGSQRTRTSWL